MYTQVTDDEFSQLVERHDYNDDAVSAALYHRFGPNCPGISSRSVRRRRTRLGLIKSGLDSVVTRDELGILINDGHDDGSIAHLLRRRHSLPSLSPLTVRALRLKYGLHRRRIATEAEVREAVADAIEELGPYAGRGYIIGHARAIFGHSIGTKRINQATAVLAPQDHQDRTFQPRTKIRTKPFKTFYFGDTLSIDQNEKLALYSVYLFGAMDCHSRKLC